MKRSLPRSLVQETRLAAYRLLVEGGPEGIPAGRIAALLDVAPAALSFHLKELSHARLVSSRQQGRFVYNAADFEQMASLMTFLTQNCCKGMHQSVSQSWRPRLATAARERRNANVQ